MGLYKKLEDEWKAKVTAYELLRVQHRRAIQQVNTDMRGKPCGRDMSP